MARPKKTIRTVFKKISLPEDLAARVELECYSELEGKIPVGAQQEFFVRMLRDYFEKKDVLTPATSFDTPSPRYAEHG